MTVIYAVTLSVVGVAVVVVLLKLISAVLSFQNNGIAVKDGKITAYYGSFTKAITVFNTRNLIAVENVTTPLRKKAGITSLVMHLKTNALSNEVRVQMQKDTLSDELGELLIL